MPEWHPMPRHKSEFPGARPRCCCVPIDERHWHTLPKDGVPRENFVVTDRLNRLASLKQPLAPRPRERRRRVVISTDECAEMHQHIVMPDIVREITTAGVTGSALGGDFSLNVGQNLSPLVVKPQRT